MKVILLHVPYRVQRLYVKHPLQSIGMRSSQIKRRQLAFRITQATFLWAKRLTSALTFWMLRYTHRILQRTRHLPQVSSDDSLSTADLARIE